MARSFFLFVLSALALAAISALLRAQTPGRLLAEADTHLSADFVCRSLAKEQALAKEDTHTHNKC